jgi:hypothetical protein
MSGKLFTDLEPKSKTCSDVAALTVEPMFVNPLAETSFSISEGTDLNPPPNYSPADNSNLNVLSDPNISQNLRKSSFESLCSGGT